jgi:hypothetical protein
MSVAEHVSDLGEAKSTPVTNKASTSVGSVASGGRNRGNGCLDSGTAVTDIPQ